eukprot:11154966-Lingulodinium_polyedra.AAC.1
MARAPCATLTRRRRSEPRRPVSRSTCARWTGGTRAISRCWETTRSRPSALCVSWCVWLAFSRPDMATS